MKKLGDRRATIKLSDLRFHRWLKRQATKREVTIQRFLKDQTKYKK